MRARVDPEFVEFLMRVGNGTEPATESGKIRIPAYMLIPNVNEDQATQTLISEVYPQFRQFHTNPEAMCS